MSERFRPSVTVAAIIARDDADAQRFLVVEERTPEGLRLNNPAGHLEPQESLLDAVVRETREETARAFHADRLVGIYMARYWRPQRGEDVTYLRFAFGGGVGEPDPAQPLDTAIVGTHWMTLPELRACQPRHRSEHLLQCIEDFVAGRRLPLDAITTGASVYGPCPAP